MENTPNSVSHPFPHKFPNESYTNNEWFRPATQDYPEFSKIPRLRPSSKNVMSIKREDLPMHQSPVAAMINDSNGSSSGEERMMNRTHILDNTTVPLTNLQPPARPPNPSPTLLREIETELLFSPQDYFQHEDESPINSSNQMMPPPPAAPPPPDLLAAMPDESQISIKREMSPVILRNSIATGGEFR